MTSFWCFYCFLWTYFTPFPSVSIVHFEQVNVSWVMLFWFILLPEKNLRNINKSEMYQSTTINEKPIMVNLWVLFLKVCTMTLKNFKHSLKISRPHYMSFYQNHEIVSSLYSRVIKKLEMFFNISCNNIWRKTILMLPRVVLMTLSLVRVNMLETQMKIKIKVIWIISLQYFGFSSQCCLEMYMKIWDIKKTAYKFDTKSYQNLKVFFFCWFLVFLSSSDSLILGFRYCIYQVKP